MILQDKFGHSDKEGHRKLRHFTFSLIFTRITLCFNKSEKENILFLLQAKAMEDGGNA